jgi:hypothetical protein
MGRINLHNSWAAPTQPKPERRKKVIKRLSCGPTFSDRLQEHQPEQPPQSSRQQEEKVGTGV